MQDKLPSPIRVMPWSLLVVSVGILFATTAVAAPGLYSVNASGRTYSGNLLQLPIAGPATGSGIIQQDPAIDGGKGPIKLFRPLPGMPTQPILNRAAVPAQIGLWQAGGKNVGDVLSLATALDVQLPGQGLTTDLVAGGRSGPATFHFCPGATQPGKTVFNGTAAGFNPNCTDVASTQFTTSGATAGGRGIANGILSYTATAAQFGGLSSLRVVGPVGLAILRQKCPVAYCPNPSSAGQFTLATSYLNSTGVGDSLGAPAIPLPLQHVKIKAMSGYASTGIVTAPGATLLPATGLVSNTAWGGPLTTGLISMHVTNNAGPLPLSFTMAGYDNRDAAGLGNIMLVTGSVSQLSSPLGTSGNANRSFIKLEITPEPSMLLGASGALVALLVSHTLVRRQSRRS